MSEQTPRKGDKVRWTSVIEGVVEDFFPGEIHINDGGDDPDGNVRVLPMGEASVEVLERADDPGKDPVPGTPAAEASGLVSFLAPADWRLQLDGADPAYLMESWQVSGPAEAGEGDRGFCMLDDCVAAPRCSSGATVWHNRTDECGLPKPEARVFRADGPEPPAGVDKLEPSEPLRGWTHIQRDGRWWRWVNETGRAFSAQEWSLLPSNVEFREVV